MPYLLSVIIPTKNRYPYLRECLSSVVSLHCHDIEIVVQDNTVENSEILPFINGLHWPDIKYYHEVRSLSQSENSDLAVGNATGKYVCYIGDDDTITEQMIEVVKWADANGIDSLIFPVAIYFWPDVLFKFFRYPPLSFPRSSCTAKPLAAKDELNRVLAQGATSLGKMPKVYHGIVLRNALEEVRAKTGSYFPGPSPDMANATALALLVKSHVWVDLPLLVSGYSFKSAGGMGTRGAHKARIRDVAQLPVDTEDKWETSLPRIWLACTIWAESCAKALRAMGQDALLARMDWCYVYATMLVHHTECRSDVMPYIWSVPKGLRTLFWASFLLLKRSTDFAMNFVRTKLGVTAKMTYDSVATLGQAMEVVDAYNRSLDIVARGLCCRGRDCGDSR